MSQPQNAKKNGHQPVTEESGNQPTQKNGDKHDAKDDGAAKPRERRFWSRSEADSQDKAEPEVIDDDQPLASSTEVEELQRRITELETKLSATLSQYKDALDGFEAAKARLKRDVDKEIALGRRNLVVPLLDVVDNLERALSTGAAAQENSALHQGVTMVRDQFLLRLKEQGITKVEAQGQTFNPNHFEAISTVPVAEKEQDGLIIGVIRDAYQMQGESVRHGLVAVGKFSE